MMESSKAIAQRAAKQGSSVNMEGVHMPNRFAGVLKNPQAKTTHGAVIPDSAERESLRHKTWQSGDYCRQRFLYHIYNHRLLSEIDA